MVGPLLTIKWQALGAGTTCTAKLSARVALSVGESPEASVEPLRQVLSAMTMFLLLAQARVM